MFTHQLLKFCYDLKNKNLPAYFINMFSLLQLITYHHNIRQLKNYSLPLVKHVFARKVLSKATLHKLRPFDNAERSDDHNFLMAFILLIIYNMSFRQLIISQKYSKQSCSVLPEYMAT